MKDFGARVRTQRQALGLTREEFCGDETELSIRQLARIESGTSLPTLNKVYYIAKQLGVAIGDLTDGANLELPERYKELKYLILRVPTYADEERIKEREAQFDEIFLNYYDELPEEEQLVIDCMQAKMDVVMSENVDFGVGILSDYFEQLQLRRNYKLNDLVLIDLYLSCVVLSSFSSLVYQSSVFDSLLETVMNQVETTAMEELVYLNKIILGFADSLMELRKANMIEKLINLSTSIMTKTQDFQCMPILRLMEWKYYLNIIGDKHKAEIAYQNAMLFASMIGDKTLEANLNMEWQRDMQSQKNNS